MENKRTRLFDNHHLNLSLFSETQRRISECRKVATKKSRDIFLNTSFEETDINTALSNGTKGRTNMYLRDELGVRKYKLTVLDRSE